MRSAPSGVQKMAGSRLVRPGPKKPAAKPGTGRKDSPRSRLTAHQASTLEIIDRLLIRQVSISLQGEPKHVPAAEAIMLQIMQKGLAGNARAWSALLKYQEFANSRTDKSVGVTFVENGYTRAELDPIGGTTGAWT
jgi:hypothetical protein